MREYSAIWTDWIKYVYYNNKTIFGQDVFKVKGEAHHINEKGCENDDNPLNIVVIPKVLHYLYTNHEYELASMYINELIENPIGNTKQDIDIFFEQKAREQFNRFIANKDNLNNLPQGEYECKITSGNIINKEKFSFNGEIITNGYNGIPIKGYVKTTDSFFKILCDIKKGRWTPDAFINYIFRVEIYYKNNTKYANFKNIGEIK